MEEKSVVKKLFRNNVKTPFKELLKYLPSDFDTMSYIEPCSKSPFFLVNKPVSFEESINSQDKKLINMLRTIRDRRDDLLDHLKTLKAKEIKSIIEYDEETLEESVQEIFLRYIETGKAGTTKKWHAFAEILPHISERLEKVWLFSSKPTETLRAYDNKNTLAFLQKSEINEELQKVVLSFRGKMMIFGSVSKESPYEDPFKAWKHKSLSPKTFILKNY